MGKHEEIGSHVISQLGGFTFHLDTVLVTWVIIVLILLTVMALKRRISVVPGKLQVCFEVLIMYLDGIVVENMGEKGRKFMPLVVGLFIFIFISNQIGLLPSPHSLLKSPTADLNTNLGLALFVFILVQIVAIKSKGILGYLKHYCQPMIFFLPINIIEEMAKPITLSFRLFGNIMAGEVVIYVLGLLVPYVLPAGWLLFSVFIGLIQAFIFTMLTISYLSSAMAEHEGQ